MRRKYDLDGAESVSPKPGLKQAEIVQLKHAPVTLDATQRAVVEKAVKEVCAYREYLLRAINVRTNHTHSVVSASLDPEPILDAFKSYSTRALRKAGLLSADIKPWARHGSTIYLWKERDVAKAIEYVMLGQGDELRTFGR